MITSAGLARRSTTVALLLTSFAIGTASTSAGENQLRQTTRQTQAVHGQRTVARTTAKTLPDRRSQPSQSMVAQAARGAVPNQIPEAPLDGSLIRQPVQQVGYFDGCPNGCGACCDCPDVGCGAEPVCGFEVGCGVGHAIEMLQTSCGAESCGCGVAGCDGCGEIACGIEGIYEDPACGMEHIVDCSCDACNECNVDRIPLFLPLLRVQWGRFDFFAGVQGYKGPMNFADAAATGNPVPRSGSGSFGFYEGFNEGRSLRKWLGWDMAAQLGVRATQSNLSGAEFAGETRQQVFVTGGLFRRVDYGLQYGLVLDYLNDDWWFQGDLTQLRGELSWKSNDCHTFGFQFMSSTSTDTSTTTLRDPSGGLFTGTVTFEPTDQYRLFYRRLLKYSGDWSAFAGWTEEDDGLLGANLNLPLRRKLVLSTSATFLIPREGNSSGGHQEEGWNLSLGLVYRPGGPTGCGRYCRPMFDVADNGTFMVDQR